MAPSESIGASQTTPEPGLFGNPEELARPPGQLLRRLAADRERRGVDAEVAESAGARFPRRFRWNRYSRSGRGKP